MIEATPNLLLRTIQSSRESMGLEKVETPELLSLAGSAFPDDRARALDMLNNRWQLQPERSANHEQVHRIDLLQVFESIPERDRAILKIWLPFSLPMDVMEDATFAFLE